MTQKVLAKFFYESFAYVAQGLFVSPSVLCSSIVGECMTIFSLGVPRIARLSFQMRFHYFRSPDRRNYYWVTGPSGATPDIIKPGDRGDGLTA